MRTRDWEKGVFCTPLLKSVGAVCLLAGVCFGGVFAQTGLRSQASRSNAALPTVDTGKSITFSTMDVLGDKCALIYGGPSLDIDGFLIQDCGGSFWTKKWNYSNAYIQGMSFLNEQNGWLVAGSGLVKVERVNGSLQGTVVRNDADETIASVFFVNQRDGWICGDKGMMQKTEDGGITWKPQETGTDINLKEVRFINPLEGWATGGQYRGAGYEGVFLTTNDGGAQWSIVTAEAAKDLSPVSFTSPRHGCGIDNDNAIRCTNDGERWSVTYPEKGRRKRKKSIFFLNERQGWIAGEAIWHTSDGGETWQKQLSLPEQSHDFERVVFLDDRLGWAQSLDAVWRTSDGGDTWTKISDAWISYIKTGSNNSASQFTVLKPKRVSLISKPYPQ